MAAFNFEVGPPALGARELTEGTNQASVFGVGIVFGIIGIVVMALRIYSRVHIIHCGLGADDYLMLLGVVATVALSIANMVCAWYGVGVRMAQINPEYFAPLLKANWATRLLYVFAICFVKMSILVFYLRIDHRKWTRWVIYFIMFTVLGISISSACILIFECWPVSLFWDAMITPEERLAKCMHPDSTQSFYEANGIINIVQDLCIWLFPIPMLWTLQVSRRQKVGVIFLFCIGIVALVAGCVRYYYVLKLEDETEKYFYLADSLNWCSIEVYAAIICGSASTFRVLIRAFMPRLWGSRYNQSGMKGYNHSTTGNFALKSFGAGQDTHLSESRAKGPHHHTDMDSHSEASAGLVGSASKKGILMKQEFTVNVTDAETSNQGRVAPYSQV